MAQDSSFEMLMGQLRAGNQTAAHLVFHRFAWQLIQLARQRLDPRLRQKVDPDDIVQSVFLSFLSLLGREGFQGAGWDNLWGMLTLLTVRKCNQRARFFRAARRNVQREVRYGPPDDDAANDFGWQALDREPTPLEATALTEILADLLAGLAEGERAILLLSLEGHSVEDISDKVGRSQRTVQRVLKRLQSRLEHLCTAGDDEA